MLDPNAEYDLSSGRIFFILSEICISFLYFSTFTAYLNVSPISLEPNPICEITINAHGNL